MSWGRDTVSNAASQKRQSASAGRTIGDCPPDLRHRNIHQLPVFGYCPSGDRIPFFSEDGHQLPVGVWSFFVFRLDDFVDDVLDHLVADVVPFLVDDPFGKEVF